MANYGLPAYWDKRYTTESSSEPFDWLFSYDDIAVILDQLLPKRDDQILMVGAGNAPFSKDCYFKGHYKSIVNIDLSKVACDQQSKLYPEQQWLAMDVRNMTFASGFFPIVIDKSLIDTLLCYKNGNENTSNMIREIHRVLAPGGRYVTLSLHPERQIIDYFQNKEFHWVVSVFRVKSQRWNETEHRKRSFYHALIVCDKMNADGTYPHRNFPLQLDSVLSDEEFDQLSASYHEANFREALQVAGIDDLFGCLDKALHIYGKLQFEGKEAR